MAGFLHNITEVARQLKLSVTVHNGDFNVEDLAAIIEQQFQIDPFSRALFLFCGRRADRIKGLLWEGDGFLLLYKRLESGRFQWPRDSAEAKRVTPQQLRWLLEGLSIEQKTAIREVRPAICS